MISGGLISCFLALLRDLDGRARVHLGAAPETVEAEDPGVDLAHQFDVGQDDDAGERAVRRDPFQTDLVVEWSNALQPMAAQAGFICEKIESGSG